MTWLLVAQLVAASPQTIVWNGPRLAPAEAARILAASPGLSNAANWPAVVQELYEEMKDRRPALAAPFAAALRLVGWVKGWKDRLAGAGSG